MNGHVTFIDKGDIKIHSYQSPADSLLVTTQLIETPHRIIAVDGQFALAYAAEVVEYARSLGKPLDRIVISHAHPDHYQGAAVFEAPIHALKATTEGIAAQGDKVDPTGATISVADVTPTVEIEPGVEVIDGITLVFEHLTGGEIHDTLVIKLPEQGVLVAQDVVYNRTHLFLLDKDFDGWQAHVDAFKAEVQYDTILPGHGLPVGPEVWADLSAYLDAARDLLGDDGEAYKAAILDRFPEHGGADLIDIANAYLFANAPVEGAI